MTSERKAAAGKAAGTKTVAGKAPAARRAPARVTTPWGKAVLVEEAAVKQRAGEQRFASHVQLLEAAGGERLVRFAYSTGGSVRRGPVTLRARDVERLRQALADTPLLASALEAAIGPGGDA